MCGLAGLQSQVNVQGLRNVIDAVKANPSVKKLVYTSSFFALGYTNFCGFVNQLEIGICS
jgi:nucleoside-diphosphate-sugar epimerase